MPFQDLILFQCNGLSDIVVNLVQMHLLCMYLPPVEVAAQVLWMVRFSINIIEVLNYCREREREREISPGKKFSWIRLRPIDNIYLLLLYPRHQWLSGKSAWLAFRRSWVRFPAGPRNFFRDLFISLCNNLTYISIYSGLIYLSLQ